MTLTVTEFKTHCLEAFKEIQETHEEIYITRHGKTIGKVVPIYSTPEESWKTLKDSVDFDLKDLLTTDDVWDEYTS